MGNFNLTNYGILEMNAGELLKRRFILLEGKGKLFCLNFLLLFFNDFLDY
jgi:hypothetical protein